MISRAAELAYDVLYMQGVLRRTQYPSDVWKPAVESFEQSHLRNIGTYDFMTAVPGKKAIADKLNSYRQQHPDAGLQPITTEAGLCGAGEVDVRLITTPQAQRVQYINSIKYNLCISQGLDPRADNCNHWIDYGEGIAGARMSGRYMVRVIWSDGATVYRNLSVDDLTRDKDDHLTFTIEK